ncbi:MAG TPA: nuclear transport factor 2 family protein [Terrimesophilobacter sp.]|nr:nuclear transport factor 2 family protein [Terrimesophilobacter sp.]
MEETQKDIAYSITNVLTRYCQGIDMQDWEAVRSCFHHDATDLHGSFQGSPDELVAWLRARHEGVHAAMHTLTNVLINATANADRAQVVSYSITYEQVSGTHARTLDARLPKTVREALVTISCQYHDEFESRGGRWAISRRRVVYDWIRVEDAKVLTPIPVGWPTTRRKENHH